MAAFSSATTPTVLAAAAVAGRPAQRRTKINYLNGLNSFSGLKAHNKLTTLGLPLTNEQWFAKIVSSLTRPRGKNGGGGAFAVTCSAVVEIFRISVIIPGLVLVGVAVGFVLLRLEAFVEEE
ncbi:cytochrome b6f complex subunit (petM)- putative [Striga hermonthica]|uniref:Cytochrome b6f complex subunit (PetM)- putative n=1 Tax=Striga hermonthica TaxID=68872 RepID=A0A9N7MDC4_STRHE|nr:cytochrome b6f complex subunit (petM)- putative [Striga hermonthica]